MADSDLDAIRQARLQELQSQSGDGKSKQNEDHQSASHQPHNLQFLTDLETAKQKREHQSFLRYSNPKQPTDSGVYV